MLDSRHVTHSRQLFYRMMTLKRVRKERVGNTVHRTYRFHCFGTEINTSALSRKSYYFIDIRFDDFLALHLRIKLHYNTIYLFNPS